MFGKQRETKTYVHRTGTVIVPMIRQAVGNDGMEDPDAFYASAQWPIGSSSRITNSKEEGSKKSKQLGIKEYSKTSPFENNDNDDETIASSTTNNNNRYNHVISKVRKHLEQLTKENMNSISMDLSSVSTETPSIQPSHNNHTGTNHESDVEYDHPFGDDEDDESNDNDGQLHIDEKKDEYTYNNDDDTIESFLESPNDLPRMDIRISQGTAQLKKLSSTSGSTSSDDDRTVVEHCSPDVEDIEENHHETHYSNRSAITPRSSRGGGNPASMNEKTSYDAHNRNNNNGYSATNKFDTSDDDHDDGDDGVGFEIRSSGGKNSAKQSKKRKSIVATQMRDNDSDSLTSDEEENVTPKSKFKRRTSPKTRKITSSTKRRKRINDGPSPSIATSTKKSTKKQKKKKASKYATVFESHGIPLPRTYTVTPVADLRMELSSSSNDNNNLRRSRRVRIKPLEFWKGECVEYGPNDFGDEYDGVTNMSVPMLIRTAEPTPYKPRKIPAMKHSPAPKDKKVKQTKTDDTNSLIVERFDDSKLRKKYKYIDDDVADIWNDTKAESVDTKVIARAKHMKYRELPRSAQRKKSEGPVVGKAAQAFYVSYDYNPIYPGYIMGKLVLPPKGIKDAECVGSCAQTFTILTGQPNSIELVFADPNIDDGKMKLPTAQHFLLDPGDVFRVPPGNSYRLQNHSKTHECIMSWTIIRPTHPEDMEETN